MDKNNIIVEKAKDLSDFKQSNRQDRNENLLTDLMNKAFQIDLIRETIIGHIIKNDQLADVCAVRLVQKSWLQDVSSILLKSRKSLYHVNLHEDNSLNSSDYVRKHQQKILDHFISTVILSPSRLEKSVPPFFLTIQEIFFNDENHTSFTNFLTGGSTAGLVGLDMYIPENGGSMDFVFPLKTLSFPILRELSIQFTEQEAAEDSAHELDSTSLVHGSNTNFVPFLQSILHGASQLKKFVFLFSPQDIIPNGVRYLTLPDSLTTLYFECGLTTRQLEGLALNSLPNLKNLTLTISNIPFSDGLIFRVLDQYKKTLRKLYLDGITYQKDYIPRDVTYFSLPVMESLQVFACSTIHAELEAHISFLQTFLPKLNDLWLRQQTVEMFRKWTENSCFPTVNQLSVGLVNENFSAESEYHDLSFRLEEMQLVHMAFPNVTILELNVTGEESDGLKYLFMEMKQLTELTIVVLNSFQHTNSHYWDSLLIGVPVNVVKTLEANPELLEYLSVDIKRKESSPSIKDLTDLRLLHLVAEFLQDEEFEEQGSLISDAAFNLALLKMPCLKELYLTGRFMVSPETRQLWESEQRSISYTDGIND